MHSEVSEVTTSTCLSRLSRQIAKIGLLTRARRQQVTTRFT